jgi:hypothetical protein
MNLQTLTLTVLAAGSGAANPRCGCNIRPVGGTMEDQAVPVLAYVGPDAEVLFLQTLLDESGIKCSVDMPTRGRSGVREARLFVAQADVDAAAPLVADFRQNGVKSSF